jgi:hypothetical protein
MSIRRCGAARKARAKSAGDRGGGASRGGETRTEAAAVDDEERAEAVAWIIADICSRDGNAPLRPR